MLAGSTMTSIISYSKRMSLTTPNVLNTMIMERLPLVAFKSYGITAATVIKAAWALVLAEIAATPDTVHGHLVPGQNLPLDGVESIMGPCLNIVPVRANMNKMATVLDSLHAIRSSNSSRRTPFRTKAWDSSRSSTIALLGHPVQPRISITGVWQ